MTAGHPLLGNENDHQLVKGYDFQFEYVPGEPLLLPSSFGYGVGCAEVVGRIISWITGGGGLNDEDAQESAHELQYIGQRGDVSFGKNIRRLSLCESSDPAAVGWEDKLNLMG